MTRVAVISANLGAYEAKAEWPTLCTPAGCTVEVYRFDDWSFQPRGLAMTSRLQCGIPKWCAPDPDLVPGRDVYFWIDASCVPTPLAVTWFYDRLCGGDRAYDLTLFAHPERHTIRDEYEFIKTRMARRGETYLTSRYRGEWLDQEYAVIDAAGCADAPLFASTAFMYAPSATVRAAFREVLYSKVRWHLHDQLYLAYVIAKNRLRVRVLTENYLRCDALTFVRNRRRDAGTV